MRQCVCGDTLIYVKKYGWFCANCGEKDKQPTNDWQPAVEEYERGRGGEPLQSQP